VHIPGPLELNIPFLSDVSNLTSRNSEFNIGAEQVCRTLLSQKFEVRSLPPVNMLPGHPIPTIEADIHENTSRQAQDALVALFVGFWTMGSMRQFLVCLCIKLF
jgi:hypothetical protein